MSTGEIPNTQGIYLNVNGEKIKVDEIPTLDTKLVKEDFKSNNPITFKIKRESIFKRFIKRIKNLLHL